MEFFMLKEPEIQRTAPASLKRAMSPFAELSGSADKTPSMREQRIAKDHKIIPLLFGCTFLTQLAWTMAQIHKNMPQVTIPSNRTRPSGAKGARGIVQPQRLR